MPQLSRSYEVARKLVKFCIIGAVGSGLNLVILYALTTLSRLYYVDSEVFAIAVSGSFNFWMNVKWGNISLANSHERLSQRVSPEARGTRNGKI
jgi:putative flippase GtrA